MKEVRIGCHQSYLFPYKGYFDLIRSVDKFILYDDAKFMKGKYINSLKKHSDYAKINELQWFDIEEDKRQFKRITGLHVDKYLDCLQQEESVNMGIARTTYMICKKLGINTPIYFSSSIPHGKFADGIVDMCNALGGTTYVNLPGGKELYNQEMFGRIKLEFLETTPGPSILCGL
jgi:hypothetical protein